MKETTYFYAETKYLFISEILRSTLKIPMTSTQKFAHSSKIIDFSEIFQHFLR